MLLPEAEELNAINIEKRLRRCLFDFGLALRYFLISKSIIPRDSAYIDVQLYLQLIDFEYRRDKRFLPISTEMQPEMEIRLMEGRMGRNALGHGNKPEILNDNEVYVNAWTYIASAICQKKAQEIRNAWCSTTD